MNLLSTDTTMNLPAIKLFADKTRESQIIKRQDDWTSEDYKSIEHITPQSHKPINKIGNLILLPQKINSKVGTKNFLKKKKEYQKCIETSPNGRPHIPVLKEITSYGKDDLDKKNYLSEKAIDSRGETLANSIWETLAEDWLDWKGD